MTEPPIELSGEVLEAYRLHIEDLVRREVYAEMEEADRRRAEFLRQFVERNRHDPEWTARRDMVRAARERRRQEILAAQAKEPA
jgi:hypothetical protein